MRSLLRLSFCFAILWMASPAQAQAPEGSPRQKEKEALAAVPALPADSLSKQTVDLPGRALRFTAAAGFVRLTDDKDAPEADIGITAYTLDGGDPATRPVTFVLNGGPGMASAWLQMGAMGPWRVEMSPAPSAASTPQPNPDTWLDFTDLVFIDPVGTGYSRFLAPGDDVRRRLWSVNGDIDALSQAMRRWLDKSGRIGSPKFLVGESYGGFRAPRLARRLAEHDGVGLRGLVMISPALDFGNRSGAFDLVSYVGSLPSMAAAERAGRGQPVSRDDLKEVESYASGPFLADVLRGFADPDAHARVIERVSALTGLDPALVQQSRGLISARSFAREHDRRTGRVDSLYDVTVALPDPHPEFAEERNADPMLETLPAPITGAVLSVYEKLHWHPEGAPYRLFNEEAAQQWDFGHDFIKPQSMSALRQALALDPGLHVIIAHGLFDLVCPYYTTQLLLNQIPPASGGDRVRLVTLPGGHMFYSRGESREALRAEAAKLIGGAAP